MKTLYDMDVIAWAQQQIALLRAGEFAQLDLNNLIEEIDDVARRERHALQSRMVVLLSHLLKWQYQPERRGRSWINIIAEQRITIVEDVKDGPSLQPMLQDAGWLAGAYRRARARTIATTGVEDLPERLPWSLEQILAADFFPQGEVAEGSRSRTYEGASDAPHRV